MLFGSAATGRLHSDSDIDVGISMESRGEIAPALRVALERAVGRSVDVVMLDEAPPLVRFEIARDGVVLMERHPHGWADFRAHAMIDWWDWAPTARMIHEATAARLRDEAQRGPT